MTDLESRLRQYDSAGGPPRLPAADVAYTPYDGPLGPMVLAVAAGRLVASSFEPESAVTERLASRVSPRVLRQPARLDTARRELDEFLAGRRTRFDIPVNLALTTPFQRAVLEAVAASAGYGRTVSYGTVAAEIGRPRAARAVGAALRANPCCLFVPCHRVLGAGGDLTGYAGGLAAKRWLLELERGGRPSVR